MQSPDPDAGGYDAAEPAPRRKRDAGPVPPAALDYERAVVAACLDSEDACAVARRYMDAQDCYDERHTWALRAAWAIVDAAGRADPLAAMEWLREQGKDGLCPISYVADIAQGAGLSSMVGTYARKIRQCRIAREMLVATHQLQAEGYAPRCNLDAVSDLWDRLHRRVESLRIAKRADQDAPSLGVELSDLADALTRGEPDGPVLRTEFAQLDRLLGGGCKGGQLVVVAGRPGEGKTTVALNFAANWCRVGKRVLFVSLEMQRRELYLRLASSVAGLDIARPGNLWDVGRRQGALSTVSDWRIRINDSDSQGMDRIWQWVNDAYEAERADAVVIDNIQEVRHPPRERLHEAIGDCARRCKQLAKRLDVPVVLLAQASRDIETRGLDADYRMSDVADSKGIEAAADVVLFCWRPNDGDGRFDAHPGYRELQVVKNRSGQTGVVPCTFDGAAATWTEAERRVRRSAASQASGLVGLRGGRSPRNPRSPQDGGNDD